MQVEIIDPSKDKRWDELVWNHPEGTIFHTSNWARVIQKSYGYQPYYCLYEDDSIRAVFPAFLIPGKIWGKRLVCLPFTDECAPLFASHQNIVDNGNIILTIVKMIKSEKIKGIEIRGGNEYLLKNNDFVPLNYYKLFRLNLSPGLNLLWQKFKQKSVRYPIKKAQKLGIEVVHSDNLEGMASFYKLNLLTRKKHGVLPQPYNFFFNIYQEIINKGLGFILIAYYKSLPIASSIFFIYKKMIYHKFNASDINYLRHQPNHLILWTAIQWAVENGYGIFDLGRTSPDNKGLMLFKRHWGAQEFDLPYYYWPEIKGTSATKESSLKYKIASSVLRKTPISILKIAGNLFYKHLG